MRTHPACRGRERSEQQYPKNTNDRAEEDVRQRRAPHRETAADHHQRGRPRRSDALPDDHGAALLERQRARMQGNEVVAAAAVELCMTIVMMIPIPARIHCEPGPVNASKFHETPAIPVCRYSIAMKISPKPARIAPTDRVLPLQPATEARQRRGWAGPRQRSYAKAEDRYQPGRRGRSERRTHDDPDCLRERHQSRTDEADDGEDCGSRGLNHRREERTGCNRAESSRSEPLERAA